MGGELSHAEVTELLGVYALDAVDAAESAAVLAHLRNCLQCQIEVAEHREVAAFLAPATSAAPERLWDQIAESLEEAPPPLELSNVRQLGSGRRSGGKITTFAAAAAAIAAVAVIGVLGLKVSDDSRRIDQMAGGTYGTQLNRATSAALADPRARLVDLRSSGDDVSAQAVVLPDGTGYVVKNNLPALDARHTYQLWAVVGDSKISVGVLGPDPGPTGFKAAGDVSAFAITEEAAGGVVASDQSPVVVGRLS
ncbi:MAG TPA: anti-sigma factor [Acidimicrobiales bacterium]|nr:anti-sigma factor [Acidimicrobiales bacterium]